ncbi:Regulator of protease activity HflC, stomatin/prohibitin superfamily [Methanolobus vulcani]|jgi:regulator of protease activity HflC (stomatin/prohibitin superfamily)|uniref:Regulator of protease activity HflC, stomatin/prohibitin superfamily n=1 Tax=Methanolobus vulcani TaxID=38026 RepID=A0A7Z7AV25_9EURY|nr:prohibitin family protein [Methanolobus vulcani]SDF35043.1 Regulator of protease activity HflC, stomatin/prohibitin superfamily [Methanolobus vulcani]
MVVEGEWEPEPPKKVPELPIKDITPIIGKISRGIALIFVVLIVFSILFGSIFVSVGAGEVGVKFNQFGGVEDDELGEGLHIVPPWVSVTKYSVRSETYTMSGVEDEGQVVGDDQIKALTAEGLTLGLDITVRYRLVPDKVSDVHQKLGTNYAEKIIRPTIRSSIREVVSSKTALQVYGEERELVAGEMLTNIADALDSDGIIVEEVLVRNVVLPTKVAEAIEAKLQADQDAQRMIFVKQKEQLEAERKIIEANGIANATIAQAYGEAEALKIINEQLAKNPNLINYKYIQMLQGQDIQTMLVPTDQGIILDASK